MTEKELRLKIQAQYKDTGIKDLRKALSDTQKEMDRLRTAGKQGGDEWNRLKTTASVLSGEIKGLQRNFKGLESQSKLSRIALLEIGENLVVCIAGISHLAGALKDKVFEGAEYGVLKEKFIELSGGVEQANEKIELLRQSSSGNLDDKNLIEYGNKMKLLGFTTNETAQFLDVVERKSDEVGVSFTNGKSALEAYVLTGRGKGLKELGINIADVDKELVKLTGSTKENIGKLSEEQQQYLRTQVILKLYGDSIDNIKTKQKDNADKLASVQTALKNLNLEYGNVIAKGIVKFGDALGVSDGNLINHTKNIGVLVMGLKDILPVIATLKIAFPNLWISASTGIAGLIAKIGGVAVAGGTAMAYIERLINKWMPFSFQISNPGAAWDNYATVQAQDAVDKIIAENEVREKSKVTTDLSDKVKNAIDTNKTKKDNFDTDQQIKKDLAKINNKDRGGQDKEQVLTLDKIIQNVNQQIDANEKLFKLGDISAVQLDDVYKKGLEILQTNKSLIDITKEKITQEEKLLELESNKAKFREKEVELTSKLNSNTIDKIKADLFQNVNQNLKEKKISNGGSIVGLDSNEQFQLTNRTDNIAAETQFQKKDEDKGKIKDGAELFVDSVGSSLNGLVSSFGLEADSAIGKIATGFNTVVGIVQTIQSIFLAIQTAQQTVSFIKSFIPFLAEGGTATANMPHIVGEAGPELFIPKVTGTVISNKNLMSSVLQPRLNNQSNITNVYLTGTLSGQKFLKTEYPQYKANKIGKTY